jgi:hypothetical protein
LLQQLAMIELEIERIDERVACFNDLGQSKMGEILKWAWISLVACTSVRFPIVQRAFLD